MHEYFTHHAFFAVQQVRNATSGYGPPGHDALSRRAKAPRAQRPAPRRALHAALAALRPARAERRTVARAPR